MASANPDENTLYPVIADLGGSMEFGGAVRADAPIPSEQLTTIRADVPTQIEWLDAIEGALCELRRRFQEPGLAEAAALAEQLRSEITSLHPRNAVARTLWAGLYASIATPFLVYYGKTVGTDLGHATAQKIIEVLSNVSHYLKL